MNDDEDELNRCEQHKRQAHTQLAALQSEIAHYLHAIRLLVLPSLHPSATHAVQLIGIVLLNAAYDLRRLCVFSFSVPLQLHMIIYTDDFIYQSLLCPPKHWDFNTCLVLLPPCPG